MLCAYVRTYLPTYLVIRKGAHRAEVRSDRTRIHPGRRALQGTVSGESAYGWRKGGKWRLG